MFKKTKQMLRANRHILFDQGHEVWWIFDNTRGEIETPDLQVESWVKPQEVPPFGMVMVFLHSTCRPT
jgi:hypothetical protein